MRHWLLSLLSLLTITAQAEPISLAGRTLQILVPTGYCQLTKSNSVDAELIRVTTASGGTLNEVLLLFAACAELNDLRNGKRGTLDNYGQVLAIKTKNGLLKPMVGVSRQRFINLLTGSVSFEKMDMKMIMKGAEARYKLAQGDESIAMEMQRPYLLFADTSGAYYSTQLKTVDAHGKLSNVFSISASTLINEMPLTINLYEKFNGAPPISSVLAKQQKSIAALVAANP